jgi:diguanylate cyclase (GGDEF)-like protein
MRRPRTPTPTASSSTTRVTARRIERALREIHLRALPGLDEEPSVHAGFQGAQLNIVNGTLPGTLDTCNRLSPFAPTLLLTTEKSFDNRLAAARAGVAGLLENPVDSDDIAGWLNHFSKLESKTRASILLVDDDELAAAVYAAYLREAGMAVTYAEDARTAFKYLETEEFDLVLLDIQMPGVDGMEFSRIVRQSVEKLSLPIIFLSAERDPVRQLEARKFGGDDFIVKPVSPEWLLSLVEIRLERASELRSLMERDSLTGLLNHGRFKTRLEHELERCRRTGAEVTLALVDLDRFKSINDTHGHLIGDRVISSMANLLTGTLRKIDIIGRYGGEEFGIILLDTPLEQACIVMDRLRQTFSEIGHEVDDGEFSASFSAGLCSSKIALESDRIIALADKALYLAKEAGRNRIDICKGDEAQPA